MAYKITAAHIFSDSVKYDIVKYHTDTDILLKLKGQTDNSSGVLYCPAKKTSWFKVLKVLIKKIKNRIKRLLGYKPHVIEL